jgi:hypothetical protein
MIVLGNMYIDMAYVAIQLRQAFSRTSFPHRIVRQIDTLPVFSKSFH